MPCRPLRNLQNACRFEAFAGRRNPSGRRSPWFRLVVPPFLVVFLGPVGAGGQDTDRPRWHPPMDGEPVITSTFGEHRSGHFHSGVDFSTGQRVGVPIHAVDDGEVVRLRASAWGYGRAIYLETNAGATAVYAHLLEFAPRIEAVLRQRQEQTGEYEADLYPNPGLPVARGELLGWTGDTGAGPPHFHFELRSGDEPRNPLLEGLEFSDPSAPEVWTVRLVALGAGSHIGGEPEVVIHRPGSNGIPINTFWGKIGVICQVVDRAGKGSGRLAPLEVSLRLRGPGGDVRLLGRRRFARVGFSWTSQVERVYAPSPNGGPPEIRMFIWPGSDPDPTWEVSSSGAIDCGDLAPGVHRILLEARDAAERRRRIEIPIEAEPPSGWLTFVAPEGPGDVLAEWVGTGPPAVDAIPGVLGFRNRASEAAVGASVDPVGSDGRWWKIHPSGGEALGPGWQLWSRTRNDPHVVPESWRLWDPAPAGTIRVVATAHALEVRLDLDGGPPTTPRLRLLHGGGGGRRLFRFGSNGWWTTVTAADLIDLVDRGAGWSDDAAMEAVWGPVGSEGHPVDLSALALARPDIPGSWELPRTGWSLAWAAGAVYGDGILQSRVLADSMQSIPWPARHGFPEVSLPCGGPLVEIGPSGFPLAEPMLLRVSDPEGALSTDPAWGLYRQTEGGWTFAGSFEAETGGTAGVRLKRLATFTILRDTSPPWIERPEPADLQSLPAPPTVLRVRVADAGSGFRPRDADLLLDGRPTLVRYDPDADELILDLDDPPEPGRHEWVVRITDRAGHTATRTYSFLVDGP